MLTSFYRSHAGHGAQHHEDGASGRGPRDEADSPVSPTSVWQKVLGTKCSSGECPVSLRSCGTCPAPPCTCLAHHWHREESGKISERHSVLAQPGCYSTLASCSEGITSVITGSDDPCIVHPPCSPYLGTDMLSPAARPTSRMRGCHWTFFGDAHCTSPPAPTGHAQSSLPSFLLTVRSIPTPMNYLLNLGCHLG